MLFLDAVWKRLFVDFWGLRGSMLRSLGVLFGVWIDAGNCLEFQWILGFPLGPPKILVSRPGDANLRGLGALTS